MSSFRAAARQTQAAREQARLSVAKDQGRWVASDPVSPQAVSAALEKAGNWQQGKKILQDIFARLLSN